MIGALLAPLLLAGASFQACPANASLPAGLEVPLVTVTPLTTKKQATGDMIALRTAEDVRIGDMLVIPKDTEATGQVALARATGGLGINGRLTIVPLYLRVGGSVVRLTGATQQKHRVGADTVAGLYLTPIISGRSAVIRPGTPLPAEVLKPVTVCVAPA